MRRWSRLPPSITARSLFPHHPELLPPSGRSPFPDCEPMHAEEAGPRSDISSLQASRRYNAQVGHEGAPAVRSVLYGLAPDFIAPADRRFASEGKLMNVGYLAAIRPVAPRADDVT